MKVVLAGCPNAGKTTLFNALTNSRLSTGNWHGVTTRAHLKKVGGITYADVPGMYSFNGFTMEEGSAAEEVRSADAVVCVTDSLTLESSLSLTKKLIAMNGRAAVYVTKLKQLKRRGGRLDAQKLSAILGVPVFTTVKELKDYINSGSLNSLCAREGQNIPLNEAYNGGNSSLTRVEKLIYNRFFAPAIFLLSIVAMFFLAFFQGMPGDLLKGLCEELISDKLGGAVGALLPEGKLQSLICDGIIGGAGGVLSFIPQLAILYLFLTLLDESGIMSALSFVTDGIFGKVNLSGRAIFSLISGFGCTAAAILTTRGLTSKKSQRRTVASLAYIPCGAKMPVFLTFLSPLFSNPFPVICAFYFAGMALCLAVCKLAGGGGEELLSEVAPVALPSPAAVLKKLSFYLKGFIIKVATSVMLFCIISWTLSNFTFTLAPCDIEDSMLANISRALLPLFKPMGFGDWRLAYAMLSGFAAKENIAATIAMLMPQGAGLSLASALAASTFLLLCPACISAFSASCKEVGFKFSALCLLSQLAVAFVGAYIVFFLSSL